MAAIDPGTREAVAALIRREASLLDGQRYEEWLELYAADATYWVPRRQGQSDPRGEISLYYDDRMLMETRVRRLTANLAHAEQPRTRTVRVLGHPEIERAGADLSARCSFMMLESRLNKQVAYGGWMTYTIRELAFGLAIAAKRVDLVNAEAAHEPMTVPF